MENKKVLRVSRDNAQCFFTLMEDARAYKAECYDMFGKNIAP